MKLTYSDEAERFRAEIRKVLADQLPEDWEGVGALTPEDRRKFVENWYGALHERGLLAVHWPRQYGGSEMTVLERAILGEEMAKAGVLLEDVPLDHGIYLLGPTIMYYGTEEQKAYFLPRILTGEHKWCEGFSEPDFGSDLAGSRTSAVLDGDQFVINGEKIWTSEAHSANWIFALCRTNTAVPKHAGLSFLLIPMDQPGVEIRPIININGSHDYNSVVFTDARTSRGNVLGDVDDGWAVASHLLGHERGAKMSSHSVLYRAEFDRLRVAATDLGQTSDPVIRQRLAAAYTRVEIMRWMGLRTLTRLLRGETSGPEGSFFRLMWSRHRQALTELAVDMIGADAMAPDGAPPATAPGLLPFIDLPGAPYSSKSWVWVFLASRSDTIRGGTSQIQLNIIGERVLGLPREPRLPTEGNTA